MEGEIVLQKKEKGWTLELPKELQFFFLVQIVTVF